MQAIRSTKNIAHRLELTHTLDFECFRRFFFAVTGWRKSVSRYPYQLHDAGGTGGRPPALTDNPYANRSRSRYRG